MQISTESNIFKEEVMKPNEIAMKLRASAERGTDNPMMPKRIMLLDDAACIERLQAELEESKKDVDLFRDTLVEQGETIAGYASQINRLKAKLSESQRRERAAVEFAVRADRDYTECDKMFLHLEHLKQRVGYSAYLVDAKQSGAIPLTFAEYLRGPSETGEVGDSK